MTAESTPSWAIGWRGAVGGVMGLAAAIGTGMVWSGDPDPAERAGARAPAAGTADGSDLFQAKGCAGCHQGPDSTDDDFHPAPDLSQATTWAGERREGLSAEEYIAESIRQPAAFTSPAFTSGEGGPMQAMPGLDVSEEEIAALVDYLLQR